MSTPLEAVHRFCVECVGGSAHEVRACGGDRCRKGGCDSKGVCLFYRYRLGTGRPRLHVIRKTCLWCQGGSPNLVKDCRSRTCTLHPFRLGRNPNISEQKRAALRMAAQRRGLKGGVSLKESPKFERTAAGPYFDMDLRF